MTTTTNRTTNRRGHTVHTTIKRGVLAALALAAMLAGGSLVQSTAGADTPTPAGLINYGPLRVLDTRNGQKLNAGRTITVHTGVLNASHVAVNLTMTQTAAPGYVTVWASGGQPDTSIINSSGDADIANFAIVSVTQNGMFQLYTSTSTHILVDVTGYFSTARPVVEPGDGTLTAEITGYTPHFPPAQNEGEEPPPPFTYISGIARNSTGTGQNMRVDITCPDGTVRTHGLLAVPTGGTRGFGVTCPTPFTSGASVLQVVQIDPDDVAT